jgi:hypothetical protein
MTTSHVSRIPGLFMAFLAAAAIGAFRIVKAGAADGHVELAADGTAPLLGTTDRLGAAAAEDSVDIAMNGAPGVILGGAVNYGDPLTSDAAGAAVAAAPAAGTNCYIIGYALAAGVANDIIPYDATAKGRIQG